MPSPTTTATASSQSTATTRLASLASHLTSSPPPPTTTTTTPTATPTMPPPRPAITAHVLDTVLGRPAASIPVTLFLLQSTTPTTTSSPAPLSPTTTTLHPIASSTTDSDGRVLSWTFPTPTATAAEQTQTISTTPGTGYMLRFDTGDYYRRAYGPAGGFFPWVDVVFEMGAGEDGRVAGEDARDEGERKHYHVPLLLSRFSYSTYRGS